MEWKCVCGVKYSSRESLLTHARRRNHKLPDHDSSKTKQIKYPVQNNTNPVYLLIQPILQNSVCIKPNLSAITPRPILPKTLQPRILSAYSTASDKKNGCNLTNSASSNEKYVYNNRSQNSINQTATNCTTELMNNAVQKQSMVNAATQTSDLINPLKRKVSRASQCTRRKAKTLQVGIESTHTQTAESAVVKIKKKRSRKKSVAITTETSMLTNPDTNTGQTLWPNFKDLILPENSRSQTYKNTTSTQTGTSKILCDSQTITDDDLFNFVFDENLGRKDSSCNSPFEMLQDMSVDSLSPISDVPSTENLPTENIFSPDVVMNIKQEVIDENEFDSGITDMTVASNADNVKVKKELHPAFSVFSDSGKPDMNNKVMDIYTQTMTSNVLDYNMLANMETQTTDDFLYDLEFLDTETQTPWDDFPNIDDSPGSVDQFSIEIQTDFSSLNSSIEDPYDFINNLNVQNMITDCSTKESFRSEY
ncbi:uncharacterized protein CEXT_634271 [Caerostris extrusa]|uniref:C2H2-type domain-containing protein n=1 Tax=Caerostris extrusa TaxID=172846 RepID=A0AAV4NAM9_CAEEX|nr:uncharacterized protein CEXT_634271 [Caerostris extrusa]